MFRFFFFFNYILLCYIFIYRESSYINHLGRFRIDLLSKYLVLISFLIFFISYISIFKVILFERKFLFFFLFLFTIILFITNNFLIFFILLERVLLPIIFLFYYYRDYKNRIVSLSYIFVMTLIFRSPFFLFVINLLIKNQEIYVKFLFNINTFFFFLLIIRFLIKIPIFGLHFWLPKAHVDAPIRRSIVLAGIILKYGGYRLLRSFLAIEFFVFNYSFFLFLIFLRRLRYFFISLICVQILDLKILIAFSSVSHISFALLRNINCNYIRFKRAIYIYIGHRLISPLFFFLSYLIYLNTNTRLISGIFRIRSYQKLKPLIVFILLINLRFPPFINFVSEIYIFSSLYNYLKICFLFLIARFFFNRLYHIKLLSCLFNNRFLTLKNKKYSFKDIWLICFITFYFILLSINLNIII